MTLLTENHRFSEMEINYLELLLYELMYVQVRCVCLLYL